MNKGKSKIKPLSEQNLTNDFLFKAVMESPEIAKEVLECILGKEIGKIEVPQTEVTMQPTYDNRGIRLDVYIKGETEKIYSVEMQATEKKDLPKRIRYYQSQIDASEFPMGADNYDELTDTIIIFICTFDPFGEERYIYTFENVCNEDPMLTLGDGAVKMFVSTKGSGQISRELKDFLTYAEKSTPEVVKELDSPMIERLDERVTAVKRERSRERMYMLYEQRMMEARADGRREGLAEGHAEGLAVGRLENTIEFYKSGYITAEQAAEKLGVTEEDFLAKVKEYEAEN